MITLLVTVFENLDPFDDINAGTLLPPALDEVAVVNSKTFVVPNFK